MIEVVSIKVAGKQIKKPIDIPRPGKKGYKGEGRPQQQQQQPGAPQVPRLPPSQQNQQQRPDPARDAAFKQGIALLQRTSKPRR